MTSVLKATVFIHHRLTRLSPFPNREQESVCRRHTDHQRFSVDFDAENRSPALEGFLPASPSSVFFAINQDSRCQTEPKWNVLLWPFQKFHSVFSLSLSPPKETGTIQIRSKPRSKKRINLKRNDAMQQFGQKLKANWRHRSSGTTSGWLGVLWRAIIIQGNKGGRKNERHPVSSHFSLQGSS